MFAKIEEAIKYGNKETNPIDLNIALEYLGGSKEVFQVMRNEYLEKYEHASTIYSNALEKKDYKTLEHVIHKIKGVSLYIGSKILYEYAFYLNTILVEYNKKPYEPFDITKDLNAFFRLNDNIVYYLLLIEAKS